MSYSHIDLHMHSTCSDGSDDPLTLLEHVREAHITTFSLTDHDTIKGNAIIREHVQQDMTFINGIEFSTITPIRQAHILGYGFDETNEVLIEAIQKGEALRKHKLEVRLGYLKQQGVILKEEDIDDLRSLEIAAKPHIARALIKNGYGSTITEAINTYLSGCPQENDRLDARSAIKAIKAAKGRVIWAHPLGGENVKKMSEERFYKQLHFLLDAGIEGLEVYYSRYNQDEVAFLENVANKYHLLISGGSDYHGKNKNIHLGELNAFGKEIVKEKLTIIENI
ncbi:PHP domain-containing protein [Sharpea azabuensis]|uniref:PHP domain-containing protein n=1 Tax=Sharpea azabuensis TaxID=322505 RepID=UPI00240A5116|nr:PHP domain-containing protein [Sharpea azabuensis]MDD6512845.1 PHP domain-containing protein [Sharpea azabuensis]